MKGLRIPSVRSAPPRRWPGPLLCNLPVLTLHWLQVYLACSCRWHAQCPVLGRHLQLNSFIVWLGIVLTQQLHHDGVISRTIPETVHTGTLEVSPRPPWLVQCLREVEVFIQVECLFYGLAKAVSVGSFLEICLFQLPHPRTQLWQAHMILRIHFMQKCHGAWLGTHTLMQSLLDTSRRRVHLSMISHKVSSRRNRVSMSVHGKGHEQLSVPCDDVHGQKLPTITYRSNRTKVPLSVFTAMQTIL
jgi:hypothetical protein